MSSVTNTPTQWQLGAIFFCPIQRQLISAENRLYLEPKLYQLLTLLIQHAPEPVSREQLINDVWQGRIVSDSAINRTVSLLRKAFARLDPNHNYVETLPKIGYKLTVEPVKHVIAAPPLRPIAAKRHFRYIALLALLLPVIWLSWSLSHNILSAPYPTFSLQPQPVSSLDGAEFDISVSADGRNLLYHRLSTAGNSQLWLQTEAGLTLLTPAEQQHQAAKISPDGKQLVYRLQQHDSCQVRLLDLAAPTIEKTLFSCPPDSANEFYWAADSQFFYYRQRDDKTTPYAIYSYRLATARHQQLTLPTQGGNSSGDITAAISADSKRLAVATYLQQQQTQLRVYQTVDMTIQHQQKLDISLNHLHWSSPDTLLFSANQQIYHYVIPKAQPKPLFFTGQRVQSLALGQQALYYATSEHQADIWRQDFLQAKAEKWIFSSKIDSMPRISHDGRQLAFLSTRAGAYQIWIQTQEGETRKLSDMPGEPGFIRLMWAPDDLSLIFSKQGAIYQLHIADGALQLLLPATSQAYVVNWGEDSNSLIYSSDQNGDWQLWYYNITTGKQQQLTQNGGYSGYLQNGQLYYSRFHQDGLWQKSLQTGEEKLLLAEFDKINWLNWQLQADNLYYFKPDTGIYRYNVSTTQQQLLLPTDSQFIHHYSVGPNALYFVKRQPVQGDIYRLAIQ